MLPTTAIRLPSTPPTRRTTPPRRARPVRTGFVAVTVAVLLVTTVLLVVPQPLAVLGAPGSVAGTLLPWSAVLLLPAMLVAAVTRSRRVAAVALVFALTWTAVFVPALTTRVDPATADLSIVTENLHAGNEDPAATALAIAARNPTVIALQELTSPAADEVGAALAEQYPHHYRVGSIGVWSTRLLSEGYPLALGLDWNRALRVDVDSDAGPVRLYVVHAASLRLTGDEDRATMLAALDAEVAEDHSPRILVAGDLNGGSLDPHVAPLRARLGDPADLRPTWPAESPAVRLDHVLTRGFDAAATVLPPNGSDHLGVEVQLRVR